ncbi:MAG: transglycosylase domain-containing protein [Jatrophihabitans sp.]
MSGDHERLHLGRDPGDQGPSSAAPSDDWTDQDYEDAGVVSKAMHKRRVRTQRRKARVAAMTRSRRVLRRSMIASTWILGLIAAMMVTAIVLFYTLTDVPRPEDLALPQVATIEYSDGSTLARIGTQDRTIVKLDQIPADTRWAVLAAEDRSFYDDATVSIRGTVRAAFNDLKGGDTQGGSGITQQYVKNAYLNDSRSLSRKLKELMIAVKLSREYSKDQILEFYLNTVYFGRGAYGVQAAAHAFFGTNVENLDTAQGALLAGLLRAPGYYDPAENPTASRARWKYVLDGMVKTKHLTLAQEQSMKFPATIPPRGTGIGVVGWKYLLKQKVLAELAAHGISEKEIIEKGLRIRTTIDKKAQGAALQAISMNFKDLTKKQRDLKNALVAVRPSDGAVLAYYGGSGPDVKGYDGKVDFNDYASRGYRPPGSSFKPYTLASVLTDTVNQAVGKAHYTIDSRVDGSYCATIEGTKICNDPGDKTVSGPRVRIAEAMKVSLNTTFDLLASETGPDQVAALAHKMGVSLTDTQGNPTLKDANGSTQFGIGIGDYPVSVLDQANGYATLQNQGMRNDAYLVTEATSSSGDVVYEHKGKEIRAINNRVANDVTLTLEPIAGYSNAALADGRKSAAKTGTVGIFSKNPNDTNNSDAWMVGFTPQVSAAVWVGTGFSKPIFAADGAPLYGAGLPAKTWQMFMNLYLKGQKKMDLATTQQVGENGSTPAPKPTYTPPPYTPPATPSSTPTLKSGFPSVSVPPVVTPSATPTSTAASTSTTPSSSSPAACGGLLQSPCPTTTPPPGG